MSAIETVRGLRVEGAWRSIGWTLVFMVLAFSLWAYGAELDEVAIAEGEVIPEENVKIIQHLEGGIVRELLVDEGQMVKTGDALVHIGLPVSAINHMELQSRRDGLILKRARLKAEIDAGTLELPAEPAQREADRALAERQVYAARQAEKKARKEAIGELISQRRLAIDELLAARRALSNDLELARENLAISKDLVRDGLTSKLDHIQRRREVQRLEGELAALKPAIPRARAALAEAEKKLDEDKMRQEREVLEMLSDLEGELAETAEQLSDASGQADRAIIRSPIDGYVKGLRHHTIGGVIRPGEPIMEVVPATGPLMVQARLSPSDRGYVAVGQKAVTKISAYDFVRYGGLEGSIVRISADTVSDPDGRSYFEVLVAPDKAHFGQTEGELAISPGMLATVDIHTGKRTVMEFLLKPLLTVKQEALRER